MNHLLMAYLVDVKHPDVSGIEHLQMLENRSKLAEIEDQLSLLERRKLVRADKQLARQAHRFLVELTRFANLPEERQRRKIPASQWWWYLDILVQVPAYPERRRIIEPIAA